MRFRPAFEGRKLRIGLCNRSYEDYWTSSMASLVARGHATPSADHLDFLTTQPRRWRHVVRDIAKALPDAEIFVWPFERLASRPASVLNLFWPNQIKGTGQEFWCNRSATLVQLNKILITRGEAPYTDALFDAGTRWMPFNEDQRSVLRAEYRRDLAWLMSGAQGYASFIDGRPKSRIEDKDGRPTSAPTPIDRRLTPASRPDRAEYTRKAPPVLAHFGGRQNGIKEGLGSAGAT